MRVIIPLLVLVALNYAAYPNEPARGGAGHLAQQYQILQSGAEVVEGYRMLKAYEVDRFWRVIADSLKEGRAVLAESKQQNKLFQEKIKELTGEIHNKEKVNAELLFAGKHITVFGKDLKKSAFITLVFITTGILLTCIVALLVMGKVNYNACREARKLYEDLYAEFDQYRHGAVERQIKLSRELQDYRNRQVDLRSA